ncbi:Uncharacterized protein Adt_15023 [Abeliophyllum distichum]|uniref:Uncharacterized protein n=1 Tax=Abeliophyllum distichum TaxID=126358 RepID=A0ABD1U1A0_9LAMI
MKLKWLIEMNKNHHTPLCITLVRRKPLMNIHDVGDETGVEMYSDFWDTMEITQDDDVFFPETNAIQRHPEIVQNNEEEIPFTNEDLIASTTRGHQDGPSL